MRRPEPFEVDDTVEKDVTEEYADTSDRFEFVLERVTSPISLSVDSDLRMMVGCLPVGGTSWTWRFRG